MCSPANRISLGRGLVVPLRMPEIVVKPRRLRFTIPPDQAGRTLVAFLGGRFPFFDVTGWQDRIQRGRVLLNDAASEPDRALVVGDCLEYLDQDVPEPAVDTAFTIVHREDGFLAVNKPAGLPCHPGGRYHHNSLTVLLRKALNMETIILVNRLDRETSGLVLIAIDRLAGKRLQQQFAHRQVEKRYVVFVEGVFPEAPVDASGFIVPDPDSVVYKRRRFIPADAAPPGLAEHPDADSASTRFLRVATNGTISRLQVEPKTGRTHQIRATLHALGYPVVGDKLYGADPGIFLRFCNDQLTGGDRDRLRMNRQALHAAWLRLRHPLTRQPFELHAPLPADLQALDNTLMRPAGAI